MKKYGITTSIRYNYPKYEIPTVSLGDQAALIQRAREGDSVARNLLIETKMVHALSIAMDLEAINREDLGELALFHLVKVIDSFIKNGKDNNLDAYVTFCLRREIIRSLYEEKTIKVPKTSGWRYARQGVFDRLNVLIYSLGSESIQALVMSLTAKLALRLTVNYDPDLDLRDIIEQVIASSGNPDESRLILELRIRGCTDQEVAKAVNRSEAHVAARRVALLKRIQFTLGECNEQEAKNRIPPARVGA